MEIKNYVKSPKQFDIEELLNFAIQKLNITPNIKITIMYNTTLLDKLSEDIEFSALLQNPVPNQYLLYIREGVISAQILCHELIHLQQYDKGDLKINKNFTEIIWKGNKFDNSIPYNKREWEIEAFSKQNALWKSFKKFKKQEKNGH